MSKELESLIQDRLNQMTDMIEVMSFMQRKMQITDDKLVRQTALINQFDQILRNDEA